MSVVMPRMLRGRRCRSVDETLRRYRPQRVANVAATPSRSMRPMSSLLSHVVAVAGRRPRIATLLVLLGVTAVIGGAIAVGGSFNDDFTVPGTESQQAQDVL